MVSRTEDHRRTQSPCWFMLGNIRTYSQLMYRLIEITYKSLRAFFSKKKSSSSSVSMQQIVIRCISCQDVISIGLIWKDW